MLNSFCETPHIASDKICFNSSYFADCCIAYVWCRLWRAGGAGSCTMTILLLLIFAKMVSCSNFDCIHENEECQILPDNLLRTVMGVPTAERCLELCQTEKTNYYGQECQAFTHFGADSYPFRNACMLFSNCRKRRSRVCHFY